MTDSFLTYHPQRRLQVAPRQPKDSPTWTPRAAGAFAQQSLRNRKWGDSGELIDSFAHAVRGALEIAAYPSKEKREQGREIMFPSCGKARAGRAFPGGLYLGLAHICLLTTS